MAASESSDAVDLSGGPGKLVLVVGPSGAGKDSVIASLRAELERRGDQGFVFPTRIVTRSAHASEAHTSISQAAFDAGAASGAFALWWLAHGLAYAISSEIDDVIRAGRTVVVNTSRAVVPTARRRYGNVHVVLIDAPLAMRAERLAARGRETRAEIEARLARAVAVFDPGDADVIIDNSGSLDDAAARLLAYLTAT